MPLLDLLLVGTPDIAPGLARAVADAVADALQAPPGRVWVRVQGLPVQAYAENHSVLDAEGLPVFVTLLHAQPPEGEARTQEAQRLTTVIAAALGRPAACVHLAYAPAGAGRQAFGGHLVV